MTLQTDPHITHKVITNSTLSYTTITEVESSIGTSSTIVNRSNTSTTLPIASASSEL